MACSEEDVFNWITQRMKNCSGSLSRDDLKKVYKGSMKELLDIMSSSLRSSEDIQKIRTYAKNKKQRELFKQKQEAQQTIQRLELENDALRKKCFESGLQLDNPLDSGGNSENIKSEIKMKIAVLQSKKHFIENQCQAIEELCKKTNSLGQQMSPSYMGQPVPPISYIFNSEQGKLETSLKVEIRNLMKELNDQGISKGLIQRTLQLISIYPGQQRCNTLLELGTEAVSAAQRITATVDLERDAKILSDELQDEDSGLDIIRPLQHHIDEMTLEHAKLVLVQHDTAAQVKQLEQKLNELVRVRPEVATAARNARLEAQSIALKNGIRQLLLQEGQEQKSQLEKAKIISNIQNFNLNMEQRKDEIVSMLGVMQQLVSQTWQFHSETLQRTQAVDKNFDAAAQLYKLQEEQLKIFTGLSLLIETTKVPATANLAGSTLKQSWALREVEKCLELQLMQQSLEKQKHHLGVPVVADYSLDEHIPNFSLESEIPLGLISEVSTLQHNLIQCIKKWKTQSLPIQKSLKEDSSTTVAQMTYSQWLQYIEHN